MLFNHYFLLIFFSTIFFVFSFAEKFQCYHGESINNSKKGIQIDCPIKLCITFTSVCQNYWATSCYDDSNPMSLSSKFKKVKEYPLTFSPSYSTCQYSGCNKNLFDGIMPEKYGRILKQPNSFDNLLWPKIIGKEKSFNNLQNKIELESYQKKYTFEFIGQTFNDTKKIWIEFKVYNSMFYYTSYRYKQYKLTMDLVKSKIISSVSDNSTKIYGELCNNKTFAPGQIINVTLVSEGEKNSLWINNEKINYFPNAFVESMTYGGNWKMVNATKNKIDEQFLIVKYAKAEPTFSKIHCDENFLDIFKPSNTKLNYTTFDPPNNSNPHSPKIKNSTIFRTIATIDLEKILLPNEMIEFELRESLCPKGAINRIQIEAYQNSSGKFYNFFEWNFGFPTWSPLPLRENENKKAEDCSKIDVILFNFCWIYFCRHKNNTESIFPPTVMEFKNKYVSGSTCPYEKFYPKYFVYGHKRSFKC